MQTSAISFSPLGIQDLIDQALRNAGIDPDGNSVCIDYKGYFGGPSGSAPPIAPPKSEVSTAVAMIVLQILMNKAADGQLRTLTTQVEALNGASRVMLEEHLKKFNEMLERQAAERASKSRGGILGWIQKVAAVVVSVFVVAAITVGTGGVGVAGGVALAFTLLAAAGAIVDLGFDLAGESLANEIGEVGAAAVTLSLGELAALGARELDLPVECQMAAAILVAVVTAAVMARLSSATGTLKELAKVLSRSMDTPMRLNMMLDGVTTLGQGFESMDQAKILKALSVIRSAMLDTKAQITSSDEQSKHVLEFIASINEFLMKVLDEVGRAVSAEFAGLSSLAGNKAGQPAMA